MQLAELRGRCRTGAGVRAPAGPRGAGTRPHSRPRQPRTAAPTPRRRRPSTAGSGLLPRFVASLLAEHQQVTDLAATVFDGREWERLDELRACLFQELVLRGVDIDTFPALRSWPLVRHGRHPLAWLPVHRRDFEANADFPSRSIRGSASGVPRRLPEEGRISYYGAGSELSRQSWVAGPAHGWAGNSPCPTGA
ncbi:DUF6183 family protein [Streptomyces mirabilis]|uniref:DUF6183 family protein n=1 Tax=Streptomyces mirabilis TaxID=68239 RepID=UPI0036883857